MTELKDKETGQTPGFSEHQDDWQIVRNGIDFFRRYFAKEYMVLLTDEYNLEFWAERARLTKHVESGVVNSAESHQACSKLQAPETAAIKMV